MLVYFYINAAIAILATTLAMVSKHAVHALLYFIVSLLALAIAMYLLGAPFAAALEVIIYAGAIMVLFVFVVMLLHIKPNSSPRHVFKIKNWLVPLSLLILLLGELGFILKDTIFLERQMMVISAKEVAQSLWTNNTLVVELASFLLLASLIGAYHIGKKR